MHRIFKAGDNVFAEGDVGDCAYLIEEGQIAILRLVHGESTVVGTFGRGEIFGEMAILDGLPRSATARVLEDCRLLVIRRDQLFDQLKTNPVTHLLLKILLRRIRATNSQLSGTPVPQTPANIFDIGDKKALDRIRLGAELQQALDREEFILNYQPIIDLNTGATAGFEALIRWQSPVRGLVPPNEFIDLLEESSLILPVGQWIQRRAFEDFVALKAALPGPLFMSLNISVRQLENSLFLKELNENAAKFGLKPEEIKLEVTERILMEGQGGLELLSEAKDAGYPISIDDFGTGYANFQFLAQIGFQSLKLDRSIFQAAMKDPKIAIILQGIASIAHGLDLYLIAEGIETEADRQFAKDLKVDMAQGYLFSRPLGVDALLGRKGKTKVS